MKESKQENQASHRAQQKARQTGRTQGMFGTSKKRNEKGKE